MTQKNEESPRGAPGQPGRQRSADDVVALPALARPERDGSARAQLGLYVAPRPAPVVSDHGTLDLRPVRLSPVIDPRHQPTELRLYVPEPHSRRAAFWLIAGGAILLTLAAGLAWGRATREPVVAKQPVGPMVAPAPVRAPSSRPAIPTAGIRPASPEPASVPLPESAALSERPVPAVRAVRKSKAPAPPTAAPASGKERSPWIE